MDEKTSNHAEQQHKSESAEDVHPHGDASKSLAYEALRDIIDLSLWTGQMLLQHGASSERVEESVHRLGTGLGCDWLDVQVSLNAIMITASSGEEFRTKLRRLVRLRTNFQVVTALNDLGRRATEGELDRFRVRTELEQIDKADYGYSRWLTVAAVALACAAFSILFGADWPAAAVTFGASGVGLILRQELDRRFFNSYLIVVVSSFVASLVASLSSILQLSSTPGTAMISSVLFLVPGVQLINSSQDLMKGYIANGITRGVIGILVSMAIAAGLYFVLTLTGLRLH
jgi:uncharacterized membrane protein YjjP (DUF1212 family)